MKAKRGTRLRRAAEARLARGRATPLATRLRSPATLRHELEVHQVELELQNGELRRSQVALEEAHDRYRELYDFAPVGFASLDGEFRFTQTNLSAAALLGVDRARLVGQPLSNFLDPRARAEWAKQVALVGQEPTLTFELAMKPVGRPAFTAQVTCSGSAESLRCILLDVSARHQVDEERDRRFAEMVEVNRRLEVTQAQLVHADKLARLGELATGIAHGLQQPLEYVARQVARARELVQSFTPSPVPVMEFLSEAERGLLGLEERVASMTRVARADDGQWQQGDLQGLVEGALRVVEGSTSRVFERAWGPPASVKCRPRQLEQAVMNLLVNATQAGGAVTVRTGIDVPETWVEVEDTGVGVARDHLARIFDPFFTTRAGGVGLGLAIAHRVVREHRGRLEVRSREGKGSTFRLTLPCSAVDVPPT